MRDNDNVYLSRIKTQVLRAADEYKIRLEESGKQKIGNLDIQNIIENLHENESVQKSYSGMAFDQTGFNIRNGEVIRWANFPPGIQITNIFRKKKNLRSYPVSVEEGRLFVKV